MADNWFKRLWNYDIPIKRLWGYDIPIEQLFQPDKTGGGEPLPAMPPSRSAARTPEEQRLELAHHIGAIRLQIIGSLSGQSAWQHKRASKEWMHAFRELLEDAEEQLTSLDPAWNDPTWKKKRMAAVIDHKILADFQTAMTFALQDSDLPLRDTILKALDGIPQLRQTTEFRELNPVERLAVALTGVVRETHTTYE